jgi:hypothetical protein
MASIRRFPDLSTQCQAIIEGLSAGGRQSLVVVPGPERPPALSAHPGMTGGRPTHVSSL